MLVSQISLLYWRGAKDLMHATTGEFWLLSKSRIFATLLLSSSFSMNCLSLFSFWVWHLDTHFVLSCLDCGLLIVLCPDVNTGSCLRAVVQRVMRGWHYESQKASSLRPLVVTHRQDSFTLNAPGEKAQFSQIPSIAFKTSGRPSKGRIIWIDRYGLQMSFIVVEMWASWSGWR